MTAARGRAPGPVLRLGADVARHAGLALRRARWAGRGWPARVVVEGRLSVTGEGCVRLGPGARLNDGAWIHAERGAVVAVGARASVGRHSQISALGLVEVGGGVLLGPGVVVMDHTHGTRDLDVPYIDQELCRRGAIHIEEGCWVGAYACVLSGREDLVVGANSVIGAGAVVTSSVPPRSLVVGPAGTAKAPAGAAP